jgi:hypothetical protein
MSPATQSHLADKHAREIFGEYEIIDEVNNSEN